jgi:hypothetical protein
MTVDYPGVQKPFRGCGLLKKLQMPGHGPEGDAGVLSKYLEEAEGRERKRASDFARVSAGFGGM